MSELVSIVLTLRLADGAATERRLPWTGRAVQALFLRAIQAGNPSLAAELHDEEGPRPYTVSALMGRFPRGAPDPQERYFARLTACRADVSRALLQAVGPGGPLAPAQTVEVDFLPFQVEAVAQDSPPWAQISSYQQLTSLLVPGSASPPRRLTLLWTSPTVFKSAGRHWPLPLPELVFGSLLERWNAYAPLAFPPEARRYAEECLAVSSYHLHTRSLPLKEGGLRIGAMGDVTFTTLNYDRYWMGILHVLGRFSLFCGLGAGTAQGLGQARGF